MVPQLSFVWHGYALHFSLSSPSCLAIPLDFEGPQPNAFGLPRASAEVFAAGPFVGDVRQGGSVNCTTISLNPHGNGTHTECVGHITAARRYVHDCLQRSLMPAWLASVALVRRAESTDTYAVPGEPDDLWITRDALESALAEVPRAFSEALVLRTLPNPTSKRQRVHSGHQPAYFSLEAMALIRERGVQHLLVDIPSVDREDDEGLLATHHLFWECEGGELPLHDEAMTRTITEMIYAPDALDDGLYLLNLQIPAFCLDAAPSRPLLYPCLSGSTEIAAVVSALSSLPTEDTM